MGLPCAVKIESRLGEESAAESHSATTASALLRGIAKQLRRPPATFAPPLIRGLDEPRRVQRTAEARLVQSSPEQKFVYLLQLREREDRRQQMEGDRRLIQTHPEGVEYTFEHGTLPWWQGWQIIHRVPLGVHLRRFSGLLVDERQKYDGELRPGGVTATVPKSGHLLHERRRRAERLPGELRRLVVDGLALAQRSPRQLPSLS